MDAFLLLGLYFHGQVNAVKAFYALPPIRCFPKIAPAMKPRLACAIHSLTALAIFSVVNLVPSSALAAAIVLEQTAVLKLIQQTLFQRDGKLDLQTGASE